MVGLRRDGRPYVGQTYKSCYSKHLVFSITSIGSRECLTCWYSDYSSKKKKSPQLQSSKAYGGNRTDWWKERLQVVVTSYGVTLDFVSKEVQGAYGVNLYWFFCGSYVLLESYTEITNASMSQTLPSSINCPHSCTSRKFITQSVPGLAWKIKDSSLIILIDYQIISHYQFQINRNYQSQVGWLIEMINQCSFCEHISVSQKFPRYYMKTFYYLIKITHEEMVVHAFVQQCTLHISGLYTQLWGGYLVNGYNRT